MKAIEFAAKLKNHKIDVPEEFRKEIGEGNIRVILLIDEKEDDVWQKVATEKFFDGYSKTDAVYDEL